MCSTPGKMNEQLIDYFLTCPLFLERVKAIPSKLQSLREVEGQSIATLREKNAVIQPFLGYVRSLISLRWISSRDNNNNNK